MSETLWDRARRRQRCGGCGNRIEVGVPLRRLRECAFIFCAACALRVLHETPPALAAVEPPPTPDPTPTRGPLAALATRVRRRLDVKRAQSGDEQ